MYKILWLPNGSNIRPLDEQGQMHNKNNIVILFFGCIGNSHRCDKNSENVVIHSLLPVFDRISYTQ